MTATKNLLFDLGGVLIDIDYNKTARAFKDLGIADFDKQFSQLTASTLFEDLETGKISNGDFYRIMQTQTTSQYREDEIRRAWNAILLEFRTESLDALVELSKHYRLFLLSNTNAIHIEEVNCILFRQTGQSNLDHYFEKAYYSHLVGMRKPNENIYRFVLEDAGVKAAETFFVDDTCLNIETAARLGFKTHQLLPGEKIEHLDFQVAGKGV